MPLVTAFGEDRTLLVSASPFLTGRNPMSYLLDGASLAAQTVKKKKKKKSLCNAGDQGSILGQEESLEKGMATHSSILAWRIPWTEEPGELQSIGSQRVRHD